MSEYRIRYTADAVDDFAEMPGNIITRIRKAENERLKTAPEKYGEPLRGELAGLWKIRVGDYRIVYELNRSTRIVTVWGAYHRKAVYVRMANRWRDQQ